MGITVNSSMKVEASMIDKIRKLAFVYDITLLREDDILPLTSLAEEE